MGLPSLARPSTVAVTGLVAGFAVAQRTGKRPLGGAVFAVAGAWCGSRLWRRSGPGAAVGFGVLYAAAMGGSHPLAKRIGAWPSVFTVSAIVAVAAEALGRRQP